MSSVSMTVAEVAALTGLSEGGVRAAFKRWDEDRRNGVPVDQRRGIPCVREGARWLAYRPAIEWYMSSGVPLGVDADIVLEQVEKTTRETVERMLMPVVEDLARFVAERARQHL